MLMEALGLKSSTVEIVLLGVIATLALSQLVNRRSVSRPSIAFTFALAAFGGWAWFRTTPESFSFSYASGPARADSLIAASFLALVGCFILALNRFIDRDMFLWAYGLFSLGAVILTTGDTQGIWAGRSLALAGLAFLLATGRDLVRRTLMLMSFILMLANGHEGPIVAVAAAFVLVFATRLRGLARFAGIVVALVAAVLALQSVPWVFGSLDHDGNGSARLTIWESYLARPLGGSLFYGNGFGAISADVGTYSHNAAVDIIFGLGIFGAILWISVLYRMGRASVLCQLSPLWVSALVMSMFSGSFAGNAEYWLLGGVAIALHQNLSCLPVDDCTAPETRIISGGNGVGCHMAAPRP
jgi:hypothetical protein